MSGHEAFGVDLEALGLAEKGIRKAMDEVGQEGMFLLQKQNLGAVGHDGLADALREFRDKWYWGVNELVNDGKGAADALRDTRTWYQQADDQARQALQQAWDGLSSPPSDPMGNIDTDKDQTPEGLLQERASLAQGEQNWNSAWGAG